MKMKMKRTVTYHNRLWHRRLKSVAEVQESLFIVSEQNVLLVALQERGLARARLSDTERLGESHAAVCSPHVCVAYLPTFCYLVAEFLVCLASQMLKLVFAFENPVFSL